MNNWSNFGISDRGNAATWSMSNPLHLDNAQWFYATYVADTWKATRKLTISYGSRWEPFFPVEWSDGTAYRVDLNAFRQGISSR
jgi:hypothetical protein